MSNSAAKTEIQIPLVSRLGDVATKATARRGCSGLIYVIDITVLGASETITPVFQAYSSASGTWTDYTTALTALSATGVYYILIAPAAMNQGAATTVQARNILVPSVFRLNLDATGTNANTFGVELQRIDAF